MKKTSLISPIKYAALSYCWDNATMKTTVIVNGIKTRVTINLADALRHLRKLGVSRIWADALCINQADKHEKGLQIRLMREIYSKAEKTYGWLGRDEVDDTRLAVTFLTSLLDSHDDAALTQTAHKCIPTSSTLFSARQLPPHNENCRRCTIEARFQALKHLLQRPYWKRRWIIQETSVSKQQVILCDKAAINLDEMVLAITRCRNSPYWGLDTQKAVSWFQSTTKFRHCYQKDDRPSLYQAIALSRNFKSTEPRDAIFSLLGLCHDGPDLIPLPNYIEPVERTLMNLTRSLIRKYKRLDFILVDAMVQTDLKGLQSWVPDWLSENIASQPYDLVDLVDRPSWPTNLRYCLGDSIDRNFLSRNDRVLRVEGSVIGRIVATTSSTNLMNVSSLRSSQSTNSVPSSNSPTLFHYTKRQVTTALFLCFIYDREYRHAYPNYHNFDPPASSNWYIFCLACVSFQSVLSRFDLESGDVGNPNLYSGSVCVQWLKANAKFSVHEKTLEVWTRTHASYVTIVLQLLFWDGVWGGPLIFFSVILFGSILLAGLTGSQQDKIIALPILCVVVLLIFCCLHFSFLRLRERDCDKMKMFLHDFGRLEKRGKKLIVADKGFIGMVDDRAREGDMLFHLVGCSEPVVLREVGGDGDRDREKDKNEDGDGDRQRKKYSIIGKGYVHFRESERAQYLGPQNGLRDYDRLRTEWKQSMTLEEIDLV
jgi:Heterokaryon incompatibility protein (HET)